jgi:hypothetical protein
MTKEQVTKKLKALKALAEQGVGGEKEDARRLYDKLKSKYGISEEELQEKPQEQPEKPFDGDTMFQAAAAATMLKAEKQECDDCPARYGQKECEECGTYANIQRLCLQLETLSRKQKGRGQQA